MSRDHVEEHPTEESEKTAEEREAIADKIEKIVIEYAKTRLVNVVALSEQASKGIEALQTEERKQAEAEGKQSLIDTAKVTAAPANRAVSGEAKEVPRLEIIIKKLDTIIKENAELKESMQQTRCQRFLDTIGVTGTILTVVTTIWGFIYAYSSSTSFSLRSTPRLLDTDESPREKLLTILRTWQEIPEADWWKLISDLLRANADWTINDHMVFLQFTMNASPMVPFMWDTYQDQLNLVNKLISFYKKEGVYISDIYQEITKKDYYYKDTALPRATAANILLLALGGILVDKVPVKRATPLVPKNQMIIATWDSKTAPASESAWVQKDAQVRYAVAYVRNGNESLKMWSDWSYIEKGTSHPTLQNIPKSEELIDSLRLYRQFGKAAKGQEPSDKGASLLIQEFKTTTEFPEHYQDIIPAPASALVIVTKPPRRAREIVTDGLSPTGSRGEFKLTQPISLLNFSEAKSLMISGDTASNISTALDIVGTLVWTVPEIAPFVNGAIILVKWLFGFGASGTDFTPVIDALAHVEKDIIGFVEGSLEQQHLQALTARIQTYAQWMSDSSKILDDLQKKADPITHALNAILQNKGILEELRDMTTPETGTLYSVIDTLFKDPDFALPDAKSPQPYRDYEHFERVKLKCRFLILGVSVFVSSLKTQIMLQRFVKQNLNSDMISSRNWDDTVTYTWLYQLIRGQNGFYDRIRTDVDLTNSTSTSVFPAIVARRQAMISEINRRATQDVHPTNFFGQADDWYPHSYRQYWNVPIGEPGRSSSEQVVPGLSIEGIATHVVWDPFTMYMPKPKFRGDTAATLLMDFQDTSKPRYHLPAVETPASIARQQLESRYDLQQTYNVYGSFFSDACWPEDKKANLEQSYFYPDHSIVQWQTDYIPGMWSPPVTRQFWKLFDESVHQSLGDARGYLHYKDSKTQEIKDLLNLKNGEGDVVTQTWLDAVALEDVHYQPTTPPAMILTNWVTESKHGDDSAWYQKDVQVRYALTHQRKGGGESKRSWTAWYPVKGINPTLGKIVTPDAEKVDCMWIYRQFGVAIDERQPDDTKTSVRPIHAFSKKDMIADKFPSTYQDTSPAPVSLLDPTLSLTSFSAFSTSSTHSAEIKGGHFVSLLGVMPTSSSKPAFQPQLLQ